jgi:Ferredoxin-like domain in Api92-like protein
MPDLCLCRLLVSGPTAEVRRFVRAAAPARRRSPQRDEDDLLNPLSFQRLYPVAENVETDDLYGTPSHEPYECVRSETERVGTTQARVHYGFSTKWSEPHDLVRRVSKQFSRLDFVMGAVAPAADEVNCWYFRDGRATNWEMPDCQKEEVRRKVYAAAGLAWSDEGNLGVDVEGDHALMDAAVTQWTRTRKRSALASRTSVTAKLEE